MPVMAEISVVPLGTGGAGVGAEVAAAVRALDRFPAVRHELTAMGTTLLGELTDVLAACAAMHAAVLEAGAARCYTIIKIDERRDKALDPAEKVASGRTNCAARLPSNRLSSVAIFCRACRWFRTVLR